MAGETIKSEAICLDIRPWSKTSHVVSWLTPVGKVGTIVKGAVRPKSPFLGQYDLNYTCEILYYARAKGELHALRDCVPLDLQERLRADYRLLALTGYFRGLVSELVPSGEDGGPWYELLKEALSTCRPDIPSLLRFELKVLELEGLMPDFSKYDHTADWSLFSLENGSFGEMSGRTLRVSRAVSACLADSCGTYENPQVLLDAARLIGVFYTFHLDCLADVRRAVLGMMVKNKEGNI